MELVCPECRKPLEHRTGEGTEAERWLCPSCVLSFSVQDRVVRFLAAPDVFYEGRYAGTVYAERPETLLGRAVWRSRLAFGLDLHYPRLLQRFLQAEHRRVLDMGCGGGNTYLLRTGRHVTGVDVSFQSLRGAAAVYDQAVQCAARKMPFPDGSFDAVVSSNFLGHVPVDEKQPILAEAARVLRDGGVMLHQIETSSQGALFRYVGQWPDFYRERLVELDGHVGLELPGETIQRFRDMGLRVTYARAEYAWFFLPRGEALKCFDCPRGRSHWALRGHLALDRFTAKRPRVRKAADLVFGIANEAALRLMPHDRCIGMSVVCTKGRGT